MYNVQCTYIYSLNIFDRGTKYSYLISPHLLLDMSLMAPSAPDMEMTAGELRHNVEMAFSRLDTNGDGVLTRHRDDRGVFSK